jgi:hypothetical protein
MRSLAAFIACCLLPLPVAGQYTTHPGISVAGSAELTKPPEIIRLYVKQYARAQDDDAAKSALISAEKKLLTKLGEAGVEVVFSTPSMTQASQNLQNRYQNVLNMTMNRRALGGGINNVKNDGTGIFVERFVIVDLRPKSKQQDTYTITSELQEKLRKEYQDLTGLSAAYPKDDPNDGQGNVQQQQLQMQMMRNEQHYFQQDIRVYLAARIQREDRLKLYGTAVKKARGIAEDLAGAAGVTLGELHSISSSFSTSSRYSNRMISGVIPSDLPQIPFFKDDPACEGIALQQLNTNYGQAAGTHGDQLTYQVSLNVTYRIATRE